ncbi:2-amino-4-hydroxy-6-hydroxymethyldihydropteridine diphosphokinase [Leptolyngbya ohadii]|uniref:2-amino-4-hydroxy-6- hydroxymethyldihydropteridine diphosphokinase n=1 Tax=Leptolyngbya ohadii TaxID=1962290 RepID=UPI0019D463EE|nr:2-amino-4-hydroxy-6-hydroxymethyldihydropteridine diphosphokinase [Leptolyngbya ohadii]
MGIGHRVAIGLGSNLGNSEATLKDALSKLDFIPGIRVEARSHLYQTAPIGPPQPDYLNACAILLTTLDPEYLLQTLLNLEKQFGRVRRERWGARTLDIDLLLYENWTIDLPHLQIPHPRMTERAFVLVPLSEIASDWVNPLTGKTIATLAQQVDRSGVKPFRQFFH